MDKRARKPYQKTSDRASRGDGPKFRIKRALNDLIDAVIRDDYTRTVSKRPPKIPLIKTEEFGQALDVLTMVGFERRESSITALKKVNDKIEALDPESPTYSLDLYNLTVIVGKIKRGEKYEIPD